MNILAIDTTSQALSAAITSSGELVAGFDLFTKDTHSERLMPLIDSILGAAKMNIADIDCYACTVGPGSFTGLRIGISAIKGLAYANGKMVAAISSLDALSTNIHDTRYDICPLIDARKGELFCAFYKIGADGELIKRSDGMNPTPDRLIAMIKRKTVFVGNGAILYKDTLSEKLAEKAVFVRDELNYIKGLNIARLAEAKIKAGDLTKPELLAPIYIRRSDAELNFNNR